MSQWTKFIFLSKHFLFVSMSLQHYVLFNHFTPFCYCILKSVLDCETTVYCPLVLPLQESHVMYFSHLRCGPGGTVLAGEIALQRGLACSTAGGTHHAFPGYGTGFCLLNDLAVAAKHLMGESASKRKILIVDLDVHQVQDFLKI